MNLTAKTRTTIHASPHYYAETSDLDAATGRATKRGAKITKGPMGVPDGSRIAQLTDPAGAPFALPQVSKK